MLKKIILGIIISSVILTVGAGVIYAYQKNSNTANEVGVIGNRSYGAATSSSNSSNSSNFKRNGNNQYLLQQYECEQSICHNENCINEDCSNPDCDNENCTKYTKQYSNMENNCYRYNNDEIGYQNQNEFCYKYDNKNQNQLVHKNYNNYKQSCEMIDSMK